MFNAGRALDLLRLGAGLPNAKFRDGQEEAIRHIVEGRGRLLVVQKTGWGKSFVYFIATKLLREAGRGPALLISPLLALMRNQIAAAERMGVRAATIHSDNQGIRRDGDSAKRGGHSADFTGATRERTLSRRSVGACRRADCSPGHRRSSLHLGLGARFQAPLSSGGAHFTRPARKLTTIGNHGNGK